MSNHYRQLPSLDRVLHQPQLETAILEFGRTTVRDVARRVLDNARARIKQGKPASDESTLVAEIKAILTQELSPSLHPVINATGVIVHTNLGRAPLSEEAQQAMIEVARGYSNLEFDLETGKRGSRYVHAERLLCELTGAEAALVVNNNAAAVTLVLRSLAAGREVIISRGELVEIGGGFRIPDILRQSGAQLVEVGTTNRTRSADYAQAICSETAAILKVHRSNFRLVGFTESASLKALVDLAAEQEPPLAVLNDLGSGTLLDTRQFGLAYEPTVQDSVQAGATLTMFSGDKLLGGPQAGIIVGREALIQQLKREPLTRALRVDKTTLAGLQATLMAYLRGTAPSEIPVWRMISASAADLAGRAQAWLATLKGGSVAMELRSGESAVGGGSLPGQTLPTTLLALLPPQPQQFAQHLRLTRPAVVARIEQDAVLLDPRTVLPEQDDIFLQTLQTVLDRF
ncbi:MAG: L-seryl-tRNA(Sec) selenium transferase [Chloroflexi bacterium]|nr:L-seryl-tRNA(Sec) selenium transferase [Chloroflexota bacterium]